MVYKLCIKIVTYNGHEMQEYVDYNTAVEHNSHEEHNIKIPETLLKIKDLSHSYEELIYWKHDMQSTTSLKQSSKDNDELIFEQQNEKIKKIEAISFIELGVILLLGGYQFYRLKGLIENRQQ